MAPPVPRGGTVHLLEEAGMHTQENAGKVRARRHFTHEHQTDTINAKFVPGEEASDSGPDGHYIDYSCARRGSYCGLSTQVIAQIYNNDSTRRGRRHICHDAIKLLAIRTPSAASNASDVVSEASAADNIHLGHREKVKDERLEKLLEEERLMVEKLKRQGKPVREPTGGVTSAHLSHKKSFRLGTGKRHYDPKTVPWCGYHRSKAINDPGGKDTDDYAAEHGGYSGRGAQKQSYQRSRIFDEFVEEDTHHKKIFQDKFQEAVHATEDIPLGVSKQIDLHTDGFLGAAKRNFGGMNQLSCDPVSDKSTEPADANDVLLSYGLNHRGKRKFMVQNSLEAGCRHNEAREEVKRTIRSSVSAPALERDLPPNNTPFYQDDLPEEQRAIKKELKPHCQPGNEQARDMKPRHTSAKRNEDALWSTMTWSPRKVDDFTATRFIEGQDAQMDIPDEKHWDKEFRHVFGKSKRLYGNAHNRSEFRFDYGDDPEVVLDHYQIVKQEMFADVDASHEGLFKTTKEIAAGQKAKKAAQRPSQVKALWNPTTNVDPKYDKVPIPTKDGFEGYGRDSRTVEPGKVERPLHYGGARGRRKFKVEDHLDKDAADCSSPYMSHQGYLLKSLNHKKIEDHLDEQGQAGASFHDLMEENGAAHLRRDRQHVAAKDNIDALFDVEFADEESLNTLKSDLRPKSARSRFQSTKEYDKERARSLTPRIAGERKADVPCIRKAKIAFGANRDRFGYAHHVCTKH